VVEHSPAAHLLTTQHTTQHNTTQHTTHALVLVMLTRPSLSLSHTH
jgi:hypothetical protein